MSKTAIFHNWAAMLGRCNNPNVAKYADYGGAGVRVCDRWLNFEDFYADVGDPPPGKTLDRRNPFGNYEPGNCRWATKQEQARNTRGHFALRMIELLDPTMRQTLYEKISEEMDERRAPISAAAVAISQDSPG